MDRRADRRIFSRVPCQLEVQVSAEGEELPLTSALDISEGGMRLGSLSLPTHAALQLTFALPEEPREEQALPQLFVVNAEVAWRKLSSTGVRFNGLSLGERLQLRAFLEGRAQA